MPAWLRTSLKLLPHGSATALSHLRAVKFLLSAFCLAGNRKLLMKQRLEKLLVWGQQSGAPLGFQG